MKHKKQSFTIRAIMKILSLKKLVLLAVLFLSVSCNSIKAQTEIIRAFPSLDFSSPVDIQLPKDDTNRLFVVEQDGRIKVFENNQNVERSNTFLDISERVIFSGEQGLLGLAFHPNFKNNGLFYIDYTASNPRRTVISRFKTTDMNNLIADPESELVILEINQPFSNHNGGQISFGPDDYLYISLGDGGSGGDPGNRAQDLSDLLGKIIRIDVDNSVGDANYSIPPDNPFVGNQENIREEIYAYGLRNVWKFSFDSFDRLWAADVGQNEWEEINLIEKGKNYGWRIMEGNHCFNPSSNCDRTNLELPIWEYDHSSSGGKSITGGYFVEGGSVNEIASKYVYGDFVNGNIWFFDPSNSQNPNKFFRSTDHLISTFGIDQNYNLYFANYSTGELYMFSDSNINSIYDNKSNDYGFILYQNYPNPFNPNTVINYRISVKNSGAQVKLLVFNSLGEKIKTLVDEYQQKGFYTVNFDLNKGIDKINSSGVYYYQLLVNSYVETKKMIFLN